MDVKRGYAGRPWRVRPCIQLLVEVAGEHPAGRRLLRMRESVNDKARPALHRMPGGSGRRESTLVIWNYRDVGRFDFGQSEVSNYNLDGCSL